MCRIGLDVLRCYSGMVLVDEVDGNQVVAESHTPYDLRQQLKNRIGIKREGRVSKVAKLNRIKKIQKKYQDSQQATDTNNNQ